MTVHGAIGVVRRGGRILIAKRPAGKHLEGYWEFPGGRVEEGETAAEAVVRELREETGLDVRVVSQGEAIDWDYGHKKVHLDVFFCECDEGSEPRPLACDEVRWVVTADLAAYPFPPANADLLNKLLEGKA